MVRGSGCLGPSPLAPLRRGQGREQVCPEVACAACAPFGASGIGVSCPLTLVLDSWTGLGTGWGHTERQERCRRDKK